jgi:threonine dehydratase
MPDVALLDSVRDLGRRFPEAKLRKLALVRDADLDAHAGGRVWLGLESFQVTGSFKVRGALVAVADAIATRGPNARIVTASAGNHGAGVAYAASVLGAHAVVHVPKNAPEAKKTRILRAGAELVVCDAAGYDETEALARAAAEKSGDPFLSPYDHVRVVAGNGASLAFETLDALGSAPAVVIAPFGGGGLASGLACGFRHVGAPVRVWGAQSIASAAMAMSLDKGEAITTLPALETLAEALEGGIAPDAFARASRLVEGVLVVSERLIARAMVGLHRDLGLTVEGGAAAALAPILDGLPEPARGADVVVMLTGRNVDRARFDQAERLASAR